MKDLAQDVAEEVLSATKAESVKVFTAEVLYFPIAISQRRPSTDQEIYVAKISTWLGLPKAKVAGLLASANGGDWDWTGLLRRDKALVQRKPSHSTLALLASRAPFYIGIACYLSYWHRMLPLKQMVQLDALARREAKKGP